MQAFQRLGQLFIIPCQPMFATKVPSGEDWIHELKHDGFRMVAFKDGDKVRDRRPPEDDG